MSLENLNERFKNIEKELLIKNSQHESDLATLTAARAHESELELQLAITQDSIRLAKACLERTSLLKSSVEELISSGLTEVFGIPYVFKLEPVQDENGFVKGLKPKISRCGGPFVNPLESYGAGVVSITSLLWKVAQLTLTKKTARLLIMDETLANVSPLLQERLQQFIEKVAEQLKLQIVMVSHLPNPFGKVYNIQLTKTKNPYSTVEEITNDTY
jgi:hypothetical protein